ncbi:MAG: tetraacyldisaccharide 4'-kinase [Candidatus Aminicenantes bacterium]|nr:tetraacyldisaccharide 4'-kinase [Candidatus Aminicenantes bacterium]
MIPSFLITLASWAVRSASWTRNKLYDVGLKRIKSPPILTISIGNLAFGGTGKTPCALFLLAILQEKGWRPCFISRGYRGLWEKRGGIVSNGRQILANWKEAGDEPYMVARRLPEVPVIVGRNRFASCLAGFHLGCQIAVLDDAFQHRSLERHLDIVLLSPEDQAQRESWSALKRANFILIQGKKEELPKAVHQAITSAQKESSIFVYKLHPASLYFPLNQKELSAEEVRGKRIVAFCGLARPNNFRTTLKELGASIENFLVFPDHYPYPESALRKVLNCFKKSQADWLITTEKDAVKIFDQNWFLKEMPLAILKVNFVPESGFIHALFNFLEKSCHFKNKLKDQAK